MNAGDCVCFLSVAKVKMPMCCSRFHISISGEAVSSGGTTVASGEAVSSGDS